MKLRLRIVEEDNRRHWDGPYIQLRPFFAHHTDPTETAVLEVLDEAMDERDPGAWSQVEVVRLP